MNAEYLRQQSYWRRGSTLRSGLSNPVVCGRKFCAHCGRWRHVCDFGHKSRAKTGLSSWCETCTRKLAREVRARRTPEQRELVREYQRIWSEGRRREAGVRRREELFAARPLRAERILLPTAPLLAELERVLDLEDFARRSGVSARRVWGLRTGESSRVRIDVADKLAVALGIPSAIIWGEEW
jgi:hypothetical protein